MGALKDTSALAQRNLPFHIERRYASTLRNVESIYLYPRLSTPLKAPTQCTPCTMTGTSKGLSHALDAEFRGFIWTLWEVEEVECWNMLNLSLRSR